jgi:hypothetical protein
MNRSIDIKRTGGKVVFQPLEATANDVVFWRNDDRDAPHWPTPPGGVFMNFKIPAFSSDFPSPPTSDSFGLSSPTTITTLNYGCQIQGHEHEAGVITIYPALNAGPAIPATGTVGQSYSATLAAKGGKAPYVWTLLVGSLPPGLTLAGSALSGQPSQAGTFAFTLQVADSLGNVKTLASTLKIS